MKESTRWRSALPLPFFIFFFFSAPLPLKISCPCRSWPHSLPLTCIFIWRPTPGPQCLRSPRREGRVFCRDIVPSVYSIPLVVGFSHPPYPATQGDLPKARVAHSCSFDPVEGDIYLWGGFTGELSRLADFYVYNCETSFWRRLSLEGNDEGPPARAFHSAIFHEGALYLFSGANGDIRYNDVWRYQVGVTVLPAWGFSVVNRELVHPLCVCVYDVMLLLLLFLFKPKLY